MIFNSFEFLFLFLPGVLLAYYLARRHLGHWTALSLLAGASFFFYAWWDVSRAPWHELTGWNVESLVRTLWFVRHVLLLLGSVITNHVVARLMRRWGNQPLLAVGIIFNLSLLGFFKYADFLASNINALTGLDLPELGLGLPLAISFFSFQQISYLVDVARRKTNPGHFFAHALFVSFFPHIVAGPLIQHHQIASQFNDTKRKDDLWDNLGVGLSIFAVGLGKKVLIAESIEPYASSLFAMAERGDTPGLVAAWVGATAYALQIFFDFSGYSDMALGLARCLGFRLPVNFNGPYKSASVVEFWRRWHITLSHFLRDHLYIALGGNRKGEIRRYVNLFATMLLGGLWHGAAWTFVIWGGLHGLGLTVNHFWEKWGPKGWFDGRRKVIAVGLTFAFTTVAWVFFRAESFAGAGRVLTGMSGFAGLGLEGVSSEALAWVVFGLILVWSLPDTPEAFSEVIDEQTLNDAQIRPRPGLRWRFSRGTAIAAAALLFLSVLNAWKTSEFIYYTF
ncbi:MBOAT family O-acyltransferase [Maricaulis sp.]|uniref:MBOAT family O-acyltransferase n=1 Tax=Maricaulis sp. TaxID=1486257 RepID=UPI00262CE6C0|nr:MBOAT family O-acyltransferase [Maricaulis sp.]